jgi:hypothetical protein
VGDICREAGIGERQFFSIIKQADIPPQPRRTLAKVHSDKRPLSQVHERIGRRLYDFYFSKAYDRRAAANRLGWSSLRLRNVEKGFVDLTLFELQDISTFTGISIGDLINVR